MAGHNARRFTSRVRRRPEFLRDGVDGGLVVEAYQPRTTHRPDVAAMGEQVPHAIEIGVQLAGDVARCQQSWVLVAHAVTYSSGNRVVNHPRRRLCALMLNRARSCSIVLYAASQSASGLTAKTSSTSNCHRRSLTRLAAYSPSRMHF